jgi:hypothetical protein
MNCPVRIDGPVKISPDCRVDLSEYLKEVDHLHRGFDIGFKVSAIELDTDAFSVEESSEHLISSVGSYHSSFSFEAEDDEIPTIRNVDFALGVGNDLFLSACDERVKSVTLSYVDITLL